MRSRTSFIKLFRELFNKQLWVFALSCLGYFLAGPVLLLMRIGEWEEGGLSGAPLRISEMAQRFLQIIRADSQGGWLMLPFVLGTLALGALAAWNGFSWLHARDKVDLYHALPVKRQKLFLIHTLIGIVDYMIPAVLWFTLICVVAAVKNLFSLQAAAALAADWLLGLIFFLYSYAIASLAMMLTGKILVGILGTAVFYFLDIVISLVIEGYMTSFMTTFVSQAETKADLFLGTGPAVLSPIRAAIDTFWSWYEGNGWITALTILAAAILTGGLALAVYLKRPSEASGRAMAFFRAGECIKLILSVTAALAFGLFFGEATGNRTALWMVFGLVLGFVLVYAVIQMIYTMDIRRCFEGKAMLIAGLVITFGIAAFFRFDLGGYDTYLPAREKIDTIAVTVDGGVSCMYDSNIYMKERLIHSEMSCDDELYEILEKLVSCNGIFQRETTVYDERENTRMNVVVRLKNGRTYRRAYSTYVDDAEEELLGLYGRKEYREAVWPVLAAGPEQLLGMKVCVGTELVGDNEYHSDSRAGLGETVMKKEPALTVFEALREDLTSVDPDVFLRELPFGMVTCQMDLSEAGFGGKPSWYDQPFGWADPSQTIWTACVPLYPSFARTVKVLKEQGIERMETPDASDVLKIGLWSDKTEEEIFCTDKEEIRQMLGRIRFNCELPMAYSGSGVSVWTEYGQMVIVYLKAKEGEMTACTGWLTDQENDQAALIRGRTIWRR